MRFGVESLGDGLLGGFHGDELLIVEGRIHRRGAGPIFPVLRARPLPGTMLARLCWWSGTTTASGGFDMGTANT